MRIKIIYILVLCFISLKGVGQEGFTKTEDLAKAILETLKNEDFKTYKSYIGTKADFYKILAKQLKSRPQTKDMAVKMQYEQYITHMSNNFDYVIKKAEENNVDWSKAEFVGIKEKRTTERIELDDKLLTRYHIELYFTAGDQKLKLHLSECYELDRGWVNWGNLSWSW